MSKIQVLGTKPDFYDAMSALHDLGVVHMEDANRASIGPDVPEDALFDKMRLDEGGEDRKRRFDESLLRLNAVLAGMPELQDEDLASEKDRRYSEAAVLEAGPLVARAVRILEEAEEPARALANERSNLAKELAQAEKYEAILTQFYPLLEKFAPVKGFETVALLVDRRNKAVIDAVTEEVARATDGRSIVESADVTEDTTAVIIMFSDRYGEAVRRLLWEEKVAEVRLPESVADKPFEEAVQELRVRKGRIPFELADVDARIDKLSREWWPRVRGARDAILDQLEQLKGVARFGETTYAFVVRGWVPSEELPRLTSEVESRLDGRVVVEELALEEWEADRVPVSLRNSRFFKPYEFLLSFFQIPRYGTIDPSALLGVFFLVFFGLIVGDVGYGILIVALAVWAKRKYSGSEAAALATGIFKWAGISAIFFGIIFGEFFGDLPHLFHLVPSVEVMGMELPFERTSPELIMPLLIFTAILGFGHLMMGLVMGTMVAIRHHMKKHAAERIGMILMMLAGAAYILAAAVAPQEAGSWAPIAVYSAWALLVAGLAALLYSGGPGMLPMHIIDLIRNVASYTRLMALGLAGAFLGLVGNKLGDMAAGGWTEPLPIILGLLVALFLHTLNFVIAVFSPTLHSLRLNFLEFFSTFYEAGGRAYAPFKRLG